MEELTEEDLELLDPHPDIHCLFVHYNRLYFEDKLGACSVEWSSKRMTLCGGVCEALPGGGCRIKLSEPLLQLRPVKDLKNTLLHEMCHAYIMLNGLSRIDGDPGGHGKVFKSLIGRINASAVPDCQRPPSGYKLTVYHDWMAEVDHFRQHHWACELCGSLVKRAMNRPPQLADCPSKTGRVGGACGELRCAWHAHLRNCGGRFVKIKEPHPKPRKQGAKAAVKRQKKDVASSSRPITDFLASGSAPAAATAGAAGGPSSANKGPPTSGLVAPSAAQLDPSARRELLAAAALRRVRAGAAAAPPSASASGDLLPAAPRPAGGSAASAAPQKPAEVACPICGASWPGKELTNEVLNAHIDACLAAG